MRNAASLRGPLSAPTNERYLRSPVGLLRGAWSGPEPTVVGGDEDGSNSSSLLPPPPPKRPRVEVVEAAGRHLPDCLPTRGRSHDMFGWPTDHHDLTSAWGDGAAALGSAPSELWPAEQSGLEEGPALLTRPPPPMSRAPAWGTATIGPHAWTPQIHRSAGDESRLFTSRLPTLQQGGCTSQPPSATERVRVLSYTLPPSQPTRPGVGAGQPQPLHNTTSSCTHCRHDQPLLPTPHPRVASPPHQHSTARSAELDDAAPLPDHAYEPVLADPHTLHGAVREEGSSLASDNADAEEDTAPHIDFRNVLDFVCDTFPEARASVHHERMPLAQACLLCLPHRPT